MQDAQPNAFVVVDFWRVKPGKQAQLERVLTESAAILRQQSGVLSVDFTRLIDDPDRYLVVFRYESEAAREAFVATTELQSTMRTLSELWDLDSAIYRGVPIVSG